MAEPPVGGPSNPTLLASSGNPLRHLLVEGAGLKFYKGIKLPLPGPLFATWLGPKPIGFLEPETFGLPRDYFLGLTPEEILDLASGEAAKQGAEQRKVLQSAQAAAVRLAQLQANIGVASDLQLQLAEAVVYRLQALQASSEYFRNRIDVPIGILTDIDRERFKRLRAVPPNVAPVAMLQALQAVNPPDP
jgi:hypothetical protein